MSKEKKLHHPWLIAVWPGMGSVALSAGFYLLAKLGMQVIAELDAQELFDVDHVEVKDGIARSGRRPRNRFFLWNDPEEQRDLVLFLGEAQPPLGKYAFCRHLIDYAKHLGVEKVLTFAAMATRMHPEHRARVFAAATDQAGLDDLKRLDLEVLEDGHIGGLNGVLLGAAADDGLPGACLLGEMPHLFSQFAFPKASLAILEVFRRLIGVSLDLSELAGRVEEVEAQLGELLEQVERQLGHPAADEEEEETYTAEPAEEERPNPAQRERLERLFAQAREDRSKAFELKQELDRLGLFAEYEDRFLDLFKKST